MKNTYLMSYFPLVSIILFSLSLAMLVEVKLLQILRETGIYNGMQEFFSESGIKLSLLLLLLIVFFMVFAALKLIANTINELSLLFFSKDFEGDSLKLVRKGAIIYFIGSIISLASTSSFIGIVAIFCLTTISYFVFYVFKVSQNLTISGVIGLIFFQVFTWSTLLIGVFYIVIKVYNSVIASLPL